MATPNQLLQSLVDPEAVLSSSSAIRPTPIQAHELALVAQKFLEARPDLRKMHIQFQRHPMRGAYSASPEEKPGSITIGEPSAAIFGHELGHAENLEGAPYYKTFLGLARNISNLANALAIPAALATRVFIEDVQSRNQLLNLMTGVTVAANAPVLAEELGATLNALKRSGHKWEDLKVLGPALLSHVANAVIPATSFQIARML